MFWRKHKHLNILVNRVGATVYQDGRYLHVDVKLSTKSTRDRGTLHDVLNAISDAIPVEKTAADTQIVEPNEGRTPTELLP